MPFSFPFFRSQSNLLSSKKDKLEQSAAEDSKIRSDFQKADREFQNQKRKEHDIKFAEDHFEFNLKEIDRRRDALTHLDQEEKGFQRRMDALLTAKISDPKEIARNIAATKEITKKLEKLAEIRRHYDAEITHLEEQNKQVSKRMH